MRNILWLSLLVAAAGSCQAPAPGKHYYQMTLKEVDQDIRQVHAQPRSNAQKMDYFSERFLGAPYELTCEAEGENGLYETQPLCNLRQVNCMTYCEIVLALSLSSSYEEFFNVLQHVRYDHGIISMETRNHYTMADWLPANAWCLEDVTRQTGGVAAQPLTRTISHRTFFGKKGITDLPVVRPDRRVTIDYIPLGDLASCEARLQSGDIVALIQNKPDIFSAHMLLIIKNEKGTFFRHASMSAGHVLDQPFAEYIASLKKKPLYQGMSFMRVRERVDWRLPDATRGKIEIPAAE